MARKPLLQARVENSTKEAVDDYADAENLSQSEAVRRLIQHGLADEGYTASGNRNWLERLAAPHTMRLGEIGLLTTVLCYYSAWFLSTTGDTLLALAVAILGIFTTLLATGIILAAALAQLALARPLRGLLPFADGETA